MAGGWRREVGQAPPPPDLHADHHSRQNSYKPLDLSPASMAPLQSGPSFLAQMPDDLALLASLPDRPDLLSLLSSAGRSSATPPSTTERPSALERAPEAPPQTADAALPIARHFMTATATDVAGREKEVERLGERIDGLRAQLEEVRDGLREGSSKPGWTAREDDSSLA
jgi:hypothetical protein